jgi:hypothetical protein
MKNQEDVETSVCENERTGLPWITTWRGAYIFVIVSFVLWLGLLIALTEFGA